MTGLLATFLLVFPLSAQSVILHLRNGDRITGTIVSESTNAVVLSTTFAGQITVAANEIARRETVPTPDLPQPPSPADPAEKPPGSESVAGAMPSPPSSAEKPPAPSEPAASPPPPSELRKFLSEWNGELQLGMSLGFSTTDRQTYTGRFKAAHAHESLKNILDYSAAYGRTDGVLSENQMEGSWKIEYDLTKHRRFHVYNSIGAGYNEIQRIDFRYDIGPGLGYKIVLRTNMLMKLEIGGNYQEQFFADDLHQRRYSLRLAEELAWQISNKLKFDEKIEFFPELDYSSYRIRMEGNLSYLLRDNLTVNLTVIDLYDTDPPEDVSKNDLQIRSSIGVKF